MGCGASTDGGAKADDAPVKKPAPAPATAEKDEARAEPAAPAPAPEEPPTPAPEAEPAADAPAEAKPDPPAAEAEAEAPVPEPESAPEPEPPAPEEAEPEAATEAEPEAATEAEPEAATEVEPEAATEAAPEETAEPPSEKKGYVYGFFDMKDPQEFKEVYSPMAEPTLEPYDGKFIMKHALAPPLAEKMGMKESKGFGETGMMAFMLEFPSFEKAMGWFTGPEYAAVLTKRDEVADFRMAVVEGAPIAPGAGLVVGFFDMKDPMEFKTVYSPMAEPTLEPYDGGFAIKHALAPPLAEKMGMKESKGFGETGQMAFVLAFPDFDKAMGWFTGPEYAAVLTKRDEVADFKMAVVQAMG